MRLETACLYIHFDDSTRNRVTRRPASISGFILSQFSTRKSALFFNQILHHRFAHRFLDDGIEYRVLYKAYGLRFIINVSGQAGKFNIVRKLNDSKISLSLVLAPGFDRAGPVQRNSFIDRWPVRQKCHHYTLN
jgi:hypothetical protein